MRLEYSPYLHEQSKMVKLDCGLHMAVLHVEKQLLDGSRQLSVEATVSSVDGFVVWVDILALFMNT